MYFVNVSSFVILVEILINFTHSAKHSLVLVTYMKVKLATKENATTSDYKRTIFDSYKIVILVKLALNALYINNQKKIYKVTVYESYKWKNLSRFFMSQIEEMTQETGWKVWKNPKRSGRWW